VRYACVGRVLLRARRERKRKGERDAACARSLCVSLAGTPHQHLNTIPHQHNTSSCYTINQYLILLRDQYPSCYTINQYPSCYTINQYLISLHIQSIPHLATQSISLPTYCYTSADCYAITRELKYNMAFEMAHAATEHNETLHSIEQLLASESIHNRPAEARRVLAGLSHISATGTQTLASSSSSPS